MCLPLYLAACPLFFVFISDIIFVAGRISAVMAALNGLMPMAGYAVYSPIYYYTVDTFPATQFFFGSSLNLMIMIAFM